MWLTANKRFARGLTFNVSYTFSKSMDYNSRTNQGIVVQDSFNLRGSRGLSDFDARHRFVISTIYELPFKGNRVIGGWQLSTIVQDQSGNPLNVLSGSTATTNINNLTGNATIRPDVIAPIQMIRDGDLRYFQPCQFRQSGFDCHAGQHDIQCDPANAIPDRRVGIIAPGAVHIESHLLMRLRSRFCRTYGAVVFAPATQG